MPAQVTIQQGDITRLRRLLERVERTAQAPKSIKRALREGQIFARGLAPFNTGALRFGITQRQINKKEGILQSTVPKSFPYHFWVNEEPGYVNIRYKYNGFALTPYAQVARTGTPGYFTLTAQFLQDRYRKYLEIELQSRVRGG